MPVYTPAPTYRASLVDWRLLRDCDLGERAVKMAGELYLRKLSDQEDEEYQHYLARAMFPGILRRTVDDFVALILRRDIEIDLGAAEPLRPDLETITHDGHPFATFAAKVIRETILIGRYGALVDAMPDGSRVYVAGYPAESILNVRTGYTGGIRQPTLVVLEEVVESWEDPFVAEERRMYRTLQLAPDGDLGRNVYQQGIFNPDGDGNYPDVPSQQVFPSIRGIPVERLPFVFFGPKSLGWEVQRSPVLDIATANMHLYRFLADLNWGLHFTALPTPVISGMVNTQPDAEGGGPSLAIGPSRVWELDAGATAQMLEFTGSGLTYLEHAVNGAFDTMRMLGARMISTGAQGSENPQVAQLREQGERSALYEIVDNCERGLTQTLKLWARFRGQSDEGVACTLNRDFRDVPLDDRAAIGLMRMYRSGNLPQTIVDEALIEGGYLPSKATPQRLNELRRKPGEMVVLPTPNL